MYSDGFVVAVILGVLALLSPMLWIAWWLIADLGEKTNPAYPVAHHTNTEAGLRRAA